MSVQQGRKSIKEKVCVEFHSNIKNKKQKGSNIPPPAAPPHRAPPRRPQSERSAAAGPGSYRPGPPGQGGCVAPVGLIILIFIYCEFLNTMIIRRKCFFWKSCESQELHEMITWMLVSTVQFQ